MKEIDHKYIFTEPLDPYLPKWQQIESEYSVYEGYQCSNCKKIYSEKPDKCECGETVLNRIEIDEDLKPIKVVDEYVDMF